MVYTHTDMREVPHESEPADDSSQTLPTCLCHQLKVRSSFHQSCLQWIRWSCNRGAHQRHQHRFCKTSHWKSSWSFSALPRSHSAANHQSSSRCRRAQHNIGFQGAGTMLDGFSDHLPQRAHWMARCPYRIAHRAQPGLPESLGQQGQARSSPLPRQESRSCLKAPQAAGWKVGSKMCSCDSSGQSCISPPTVDTSSHWKYCPEN